MSTRSSICSTLAPSAPRNRMAWRKAGALSSEATVNPHALSYLNRLSDLLFILARVHNDEGRGDVLWQPGSSLA